MKETGKKMRVREMIETYYPEYSFYREYQPSNCAAIRKIDEEWGILGNFARISLTVDGVTFKSSETLFQIMKFRDEAVVKDVYRRNNKKWAKHYEKLGYGRPDWPAYFIDALKFVLQTKFEQCSEFRQELERTKGMDIVEDETNRSSTSYGVHLNNKGMYEGSNLLGRLLMELRDKGRLEYTLPDDALDFLKFLK